MNYRPEIDGLRAVAVIPVLLYHAGFSWFSGGYVGVDVFFVISGYLITTILIGEIQAGNFSIWRFYERRARRILPALCFVMLACIPFAWKWMLPDQFKDFGQSMFAVVFFASNILFWGESGYFEASAEEKLANAAGEMDMAKAQAELAEAAARLQFVQKLKKGR